MYCYYNNGNDDCNDNATTNDNVSNESHVNNVILLCIPLLILALFRERHSVGRLSLGYPLF